MRDGPSLGKVRLAENKHGGEVTETMKFEERTRSQWSGS